MPRRARRLSVALSTVVEEVHDWPSRPMTMANTLSPRRPRRNPLPDYQALALAYVADRIATRWIRRLRKMP